MHLRTTSKRPTQKTAEGTGDVIGYETGDDILSKPGINESKENLHQKI